MGLVRSGDLLLDNGLARFYAPGLADVRDTERSRRQFP